MCYFSLSKHKPSYQINRQWKPIDWNLTWLLIDETQILAEFLAYCFCNYKSKRWINTRKRSLRVLLFFFTFQTQVSALATRRKRKKNDHFIDGFFSSSFSIVLIGKEEYEIIGKKQKFWFFLVVLLLLLFSFPFNRYYRKQTKLSRFIHNKANNAGGNSSYSLCSSIPIAVHRQGYFYWISSDGYEKKLFCFQ